jgi:hypothetical protein
MKRTVLFGAGAAISFYKPELSTQTLTTTIFDASLWADIVRRYAALRESSPVDTADVQDVLTKAKTFRALNFEEAIEVLDKVSSFNFDPARGGRLLHDIIRLHGGKPVAPNTTWTDVPFLARQLLAERVVGATKSSSYTRLSALQKGFLARLLADGPVDIFSLNYDESLYESVDGLGFDDGFRDMHFSELNFFDSANALGFLHGHVRYRNEDGEVRKDIDGVTATRKRFELLDYLHAKTLTVIEYPYAYNFDTFLVTGQTKDGALNRNPFAAYYQRLASTLIGTDELILVGYSFGDEHLNRFILSYLYQNPAHRILYVTFHNEEVDAMKSFLDQDAISKLFTKTGRRSMSLSIFADGREGYKYEDDVDELNRNGFGMIAPRIVLYKKGYGEFLEERDSVLKLLEGVGSRKFY